MTHTHDPARYWRGALVAVVFGLMAGLAGATAIYHEFHEHNAARVAAEIHQ